VAGGSRAVARASPVTQRNLTRAQFEQLWVPPEQEWLANVTNAKTRRAYRNDVREFIAYAGLRNYGELRSIAGRTSPQYYEHDEVSRQVPWLCAISRH
jgi:hypothetical protein